MIDDCTILGTALDNDYEMVGTSFIEVKRRKRGYEAGREYQDTWTVIHPWAKNIMDNEEIFSVKCRICTKIEGKDKIGRIMDGLYQN